MGNFLSIITYHYVRPLNERFSEKHKFLEVNEFVRQLNILESGHFFVDGRKIKDSKFVSPLSKKRAVWLTFDDGYLDHYVHVYPNLLSKKAVGTFFIPTKAIFGRRLLDVNKVHILLSLDITINQIIAQLADLFVAVSGAEYFERSFNELRKQYSVPTLLNDADIRFVKFFLQEFLPLDLRKIVLNNLFGHHLKRSESAIVDEICMIPDYLKILFESGMNIGSHGHDHARLEYMGAEAQKSDVEQSLKHLRSIGIQDPQTVFCYTYGSFNKQSKSVIKEIGCELAVSINPGVVDLDSGEIDWLELRRIDAKFFDDYFPVHAQN